MKRRDGLKALIGVPLISGAMWRWMLSDRPRVDEQLEAWLERRRIHVGGILTYRGSDGVLHTCRVTAVGPADLSVKTI